MVLVLDKAPNYCYNNLVKYISEGGGMADAHV